MGVTFSVNRRLRRLRSNLFHFVLGRICHKIYKIENRNYVFLPNIYDHRAVVDISNSESEPE